MQCQVSRSLEKGWCERPGSRSLEKGQHAGTGVWDISEGLTCWTRDPGTGRKAPMKDWGSGAQRRAGMQDQGSGIPEKSWHSGPTVWEPGEGVV